ncbi:MAG: hypothetical protein GDA46_06565, partial [Bdellovibrionales bacterium]|nr:hypothetical protein [Bdellovibrionales bacterium]
SEDERMQELAYDEYRRKMDYRLDIQDSKEEGFEEGFEQGRQAEKREQAVKLLELGVDISTIIKVTDLSKNKILQLKKK